MFARRRMATLSNDVARHRSPLRISRTRRRQRVSPRLPGETRAFRSFHGFQGKLGVVQAYLRSEPLDTASTMQIR